MLHFRTTVPRFFSSIEKRLHFNYHDQLALWGLDSRCVVQGVNCLDSAAFHWRLGLRNTTQALWVCSASAAPWRIWPASPVDVASAMSAAGREPHHPKIISSLKKKCFIGMGVLFTCIQVHRVHAWCQLNSEKGVGFPGTGAAVGCELFFGCWKPI